MTFIEAHGFTDDWHKLGLSDSSLQALQIAIMVDPTKAPIISGTGGLRKLRFGPPEWKKGKRGGVRVCYVYFEEYHVVLLVVAYAKSEQDNIPAGHKKAYREYIERSRKQFAARRVT